MFVPIFVDGVQYRLRFPTKVQITVEKTAGKFLFGNDNRYTLFDLLTNIGSTEVQAYLLWQGLQWEHPELSFDDACDLRDKILMVSPDSDNEEKLTKFIESLAEAVHISYGMSQKKLKQSNKMEPNGIGTP